MTIFSAAGDPVRPAPLADQEVERHQHQVEEQDEQRQVLRQERAQHRRLGDARSGTRTASAAPAGRSASHSADGGEQQRRQRDQPQVQPVDAELVADAQLRDPRVVGDVLQAGRAGVEVEQQR